MNDAAVKQHLLDLYQEFQEAEKKALPAEPIILVCMTYGTPKFQEAVKRAIEMARSYMKRSNRYKEEEIVHRLSKVLSPQPSLP